MAIRFRLGEHDAAKYKGGGDWFTYDSVAMRDMPARELIELESHCGGYSIAQIEGDFFGRGGYMGRLGVLYIARRLSGVVESWDNFDPRLNEVQSEKVIAGDVSADPDDGGVAEDPTGPATSPDS